jgi:hypothetical protein
MKQIEYLHIATQTVWQHTEKYPNDSEEYYCFQQSENPELLGYKYERDYKPTDTEKPETV